MKALILTAGGFEDSELLVPMYRILEEGGSVDIAAPDTGTVTGKHGYDVEAGLSFDDIQADGYDALILPGGSAPETVRLHEKAVAVTREFMDAEKPVAAICHGAQTLISARVLDGRAATCYKSVRDDLKLAGADYRDAEVVVDGNLVTSRCPADLPAFCRELMKQL